MKQKIIGTQLFETISYIHKYLQCIIFMVSCTPFSIVLFCSVRANSMYCVPFYFILLFYVILFFLLLCLLVSLLFFCVTLFFYFFLFYFFLFHFYFYFLGPLVMGGEGKRNSIRSLLRVHVHRLVVLEHPYINMEERMFSRMKDVYQQYASILQQNALG